MKHILIYFTIFIFNSTLAQISDFKTVNFTIADNIAKLNEDSNLENLPLLAYNLTHKLPTKVEKLRAIYTWVCNNIRGDYYQNQKVNKYRKKFQNDSTAYMLWNDNYKKIVFKTLLKHKKTMCTGYAYLIKELCFFANIECVIIDGYGRTASSNIDKLELINHSWNAVKLNDKWYLCDATWSSGYTTENNQFINDYNEGYFLTDPVLFSKNHYPIHKKWLLNNTTTSSSFITSPLVYGETFKHKVIPISPKKLETTIKKNHEISFSFKALKSISKTSISLIQISGDNKQPLKIYNLKNENGLMTFKYRFKHKGFYDIHLKIDNDIIATYTIKVTKDETKMAKL